MNLVKASAARERPVGSLPGRRMRMPRGTDGRAAECVTRPSFLRARPAGGAPRRAWVRTPAAVRAASNASRAGAQPIYPHVTALRASEAAIGKRST